MKCFICNKTQEDFAALNTAQNEQIEKIVAMIEAKIINVKEQINKEIDSNDSNSTGEIKDYSDICEHLGKYIGNENCSVCTNAESVDGKGNYWCNKYKKTFKVSSEKTSAEEALFKFQEDIDILNSRKNALSKIQFKDIEIDGNIYDSKYEKFKKILKKYDEKELSNDNLSFKICPFCESLIKEIVNDVVDMDQIIEEVRSSIDIDDENGDEN